MNPAITNLVVVFGLMQVANKFQLDKEENTAYLRAAYLTMQAIAFTALFIVYRKVVSRNDQTPLIYEEAKSALEPSNVETIRTTVRDYDVKKLIEAARSQLIAMAMIGFMHYKWGYLRPLLLQSVLGLKAIYQAQLVQVHLVGTPATGALARPWKVPSPFGQTVKPTTEKELKAKEKREAKKKLNHQD
ncbi:hypothetical protein PhCBS80983_g00248 [Powellomyces hirtus]|uniref:Inorganic phosphate transporter n=1 Tax=Powellomyces hirtus TaxID=109895 RepID=A0A507EFN1_9FUNG|nr:inorganic phosphate transporter Pho88 [Powellomyces hirtus]TPX62624.1 hypothetical protein PhCBS80983_g00248 [Powellomyces hirtus]